MTAYISRLQWQTYASILALMLCFTLQSCASKDKGIIKQIESNSKDQKPEEVPKLTKPVVRRVWVPPQVKENGSIYEEGYWRYLIEKEAVWSR